MRVSSKSLKSNAMDSLSDRKWQFISRPSYKLHYKVPEFLEFLNKPKKPISNRTANILLTIFIVVMSVVAVGAIREVYVMVVDKQCAGWETKPLDQVDNICLGRIK